MPGERSSPPRRAVRQRRTIALVAVLAVVAIVVIVLLVSGSGGGSSVTPPQTAAAGYVPADALGYLNVSTDPARAPVSQALALAKRFPNFVLGAGTVESKLAGITGTGAGYAQIQPWLGKEAALAVLNTPTRAAGTLLLLSVADKGKAQSFLTQTGAKPNGTDGSTALERYPSGSEAAFIGPFLAFGQKASVRAAVAVAAGQQPSLAHSAIYQRAAAGEPADRVLDAYASADGLRRLLKPKGYQGALGDLVLTPALSAISASVSPASGGLRVHLHSALDSSLLAVSGPRSKAFTPTLQQSLPAGTEAMIDTHDLRQLAPTLLAAGASAGIYGGIGPLLSRLGTALKAEGVNVPQLLGLFAGEAAVSVTGGKKPALLIVARVPHPAQARAELATAEAPVQQLFATQTDSDSASTQSDALNQLTIHGVTVHQLRLEPGLEIDYAVIAGEVAIATGVPAMRALIGHDGTLAGDSGYKAALGAVPEKVTSLTYLDLSQLLGLGDQTGLTHSATFRALGVDLRKIRGVGLSSTSGENDSTTELFLQIP